MIKLFSWICLPVSQRMTTSTLELIAGFDGLGVKGLQKSSDLPCICPCERGILVRGIHINLAMRLLVPCQTAIPLKLDKNKLY